MSEEFIYIVETLEEGALNEYTSATRLAAMLIDHDRQNTLAQYREEAALLCPKCIQGRREPSTILRKYIGPGGEALIYFPARLRSGGPAGPAGSPSARVPATARNFPTLSTGLDVTQCRTCQQYYLVTAEFAEQWTCTVMAVESSTFGAVAETGTPTVVHQIRRNSAIKHLEERRRRATP